MDPFKPHSGIFLNALSAYEPWFHPEVCLKGLLRRAVLEGFHRELCIMKLVVAGRLALVRGIRL
jgi:hypothetical protein